MEASGESTSTYPEVVARHLSARAEFARGLAAPSPGTPTPRQRGDRRTPLPVLAVVPLFPWIVGWGGADGIVLAPPLLDQHGRLRENPFRVPPKTHLKRVYRKLGIRKQIAAVTSAPTFIREPPSRLVPAPGPRPVPGEVCGATRPETPVLRDTTLGTGACAGRGPCG